MNLVLRAVVAGKVVNVTKLTRGANHLKAIPGAHYELVDEDTGEKPAHLAEARQGHALMLGSADDQTFVEIDGFYDGGMIQPAHFVMEPAGGMDAGGAQAEGGDAPAAAGAAAAGGHGIGTLPLILGGLALGGGIAAAAGSGGGGKSSGTPADTTPPPAPAGLKLAAASDTGSSSTDGVTNKTTGLTITGTAEANAKVELFNGTASLGTTTADASGNFTITVALAQGTASITAKATDAAGNVGVASTALAITVDTTTPVAPTGLTLAAEDDTGRSSSDGITNHTSALTISGSAEANAMVELFSGTTSLGTTRAAANGSFTLDVSLPQGSAAITARATDVAGNVGAASTALAITVDTTAPAAPAALRLAAEDDSGRSSSDGITNHTTGLTISGAAEANAIVQLFSGTTALGTTTANANGSFSLDVSLPEGAASITARATDVAGNVSTSSTALAITVDTTAPAAPAGLAIDATDQVGVGPLTTALTSGITINGTAEAGSTIELFSGTTSLGTATANGSGAFTLDISLPVGTTTVTARATDVAGNVSTAGSVALTVTTGTSGSAIDGYIANALVFRDANNNGVWDHEAFVDANDNGYYDAGEAFTDSNGDGVFTAEFFTKTDGNGDFRGLLGSGRIVMTPLVSANGTVLTIDISTGQAFSKQLTAPAGSTVVTPLTTLVDALAPVGATAAQVAAATAQVANALGLAVGTDLTRLDPIQAVVNATDSASRAAAIEVQKAAVQVANILSVVAQGASSAGAYSNVTEASKAAATAIAQQITNAGTGTVNLSDATVVSNVVNGTAAASTNSDGAAKLAAQAATASQAIASVNQAVANVDSNAAGSTALAQIVATQIVAQTNLTTAVGQAAATNTTVDTSAFSGSALNSQIDVASGQVQVVVPVTNVGTVGQPDRPVIDDGARIIASEATDGIVVTVAIGTDAGVVAGDHMLLKVGGTVLQDHVLTAADVAAKSVTFAVSRTELGAEGAKSFTAVLKSAAGVAGADSLPALTILDLSATAPQIPTISDGVITAAEAAAGVFVAVQGLDLGATIAATVSGLALGTTTPLTMAVPIVSGQPLLSADLLSHFADGTVVVAATQTNVANNVSPPGTQSVILSRGIGSDAADQIVVGGTNARVDAGAGDDVVYVVGTGATVLGGAGNDRIFGGAGNDTLFGGAGDDQIYGGGGDDVLQGGFGNDTLDGGAGSDTALYDYTASAIGTVTAGIALDASGLSATGGGSLADGLGGTDTLSSIEILSVRGSALGDTIKGAAAIRNVLFGNEGDDRLTGGTLADMLDGGAGNDTLSGGDGNDTLTGGAGNDTIDGGAGLDIAVYSGARADYLITTDSAGTHVQDLRAGSADGIDLLIGVETLRFSDGDVALSAAGLTLVGTAGADTLIGSDGNDVIRGGDGADVLTGNGGDDILIGGSFADHIDQPADGADTLYGGAGNDVLRGGNGDDQLYGGTDDDVLQGDLGNDLLDGGAGIDTAVYRFDATGDGGRTFPSATGITFDASLVNFQNGAIDDGRGGIDTLVSIERLSVTGTDFADTITGNADILNELYGGGGADTISGGQHADLLYGGAGNDFLYGGYGDDTLVGGAGNDTITGGSGNDMLVLSGNYADYSFVQSGTNTVRITDLRTGSPDGIDLATDIQSVRFADRTVGYADGLIPGLTPPGAEIYGTAAGEALAVTGDQHGVIFALGGNDTLTAGTPGADLYGGAGDDDITGSADDDYIEGNAGNDVIHASGGYDTVYGGGGDDVYVLTGNFADYSIERDAYGATWRVSDNRANAPDGYSTIENIERLQFADQTYTLGQPGLALAATGANDALTGTDGQDEITGGAGANVINAGKGDDVVYGGPGNDVIDLGEGNDFVLSGTGDDIVTGGPGNDQIYGGAGFDIAVYSGNRADYQIVRSGAALLVRDLRLDSPDGYDFVSSTEALRFADGDVLVATIGNVINGTTANNSLTGTVGNDTIYGFGGNDTLSGGLGDDSLIGGAGNDILIGGAGYDTAVFSGNRADYTITQGVGPVITITDNRTNSPDGTDTIQRGVEKLQFADQAVILSATAGIDLASTGDALMQGTAGPDQLFGGAEANVINAGAGDDYVAGAGGNDQIFGGDGNDLLYGGDGDDTITGGAGNDIIYGDAGNDVAVFSGNKADYSIVLNATGAMIVVTDLRAGSPDGTDNVYYYSVETLRFADGDIATQPIGALINGTANGESLSGLNGNDTINGFAGNDFLYGNAGDDVLTGGAGNDQLYGGTGTNTAVFSGNQADYTITPYAGSNSLQIVDNRTGSPDGTDILDYRINKLQFADGTVALGLGGNDYAGTSGNDTLSGTAGSDYFSASGGNDLVYGGDGKDLVYGGSGADTVFGGAGDDLVYGDDGDDQITGGAGNDYLYGGAGNDVAFYSGNRADYQLTRNNNGTVAVRDLRDASPDGTDTVNTDLEILRFLDGDVVTNSVGNLLLGSPLSDTLSGSSGNDTFFGYAGTDFFSGSDGDDVFYGGADYDYLYGGLGTDSAVYSGARADYTITVLPGGRFNVSDNRAGTPDGTDYLDGIEKIVFSDQTLTYGTGGQIFYSNATTNTITGGANNDVLYGGSANETLYGGAGNDSLYGGPGDDVYYGGAGDDYLSAYGGDGNDVAVWSGNRADYEVVRTNDGAISVRDLRAGSPDGYDYVSQYIETLRFADGDVPSSTIVNLINGTAGNDNLYGGEGPDVVYGGGGNDYISTYGGDDHLYGGAGNDTLDGGNGNDTAHFSGARADYTIVYKIGGDITVIDNRAGSPDGTDTVSGRTEILAFSDTSLTVSVPGSGYGGGGQPGATITGGDGSDYLYGGAGLNGVGDTLYGGAGKDIFYGGKGSDLIFGGADDDTIYGYEGDDTITGGGGNDYIDGGAGNDVAVYSGNRADYTITRENDGAYGILVVDNRAGSPDGMDRLAGGSIETLRFADGDVAAKTFGLTLTGTANNDFLSGSSGNDMAFGLDGSDSFSGSAGDDQFTGGAGNDYFYGGQGQDTGYFSGNRTDYTLTVQTGGGYAVQDNRTGSPDGRDFLDCFVEFAHFADQTVTLQTEGVFSTPSDYSQQVIFNGTVNNDNVSGGSAADILYGGEGNDNLFGGSGADQLFGGGGYDYLDGGDGDDTLSGGAGNDILYGGNGNDVALFSGTKAEYAIGLSGTQITISDLRAGSPDGSDTGNQIETLRFADGDLTVSASTIGSDFANDSLFGTSGNDALYGGGGSDTIIGGAGDDLIVGGAGKDRLTGGTGDDQFVLEPSAGTTLSLADVITDFSVSGANGTDKMLLNGLSFGDLVIEQGTGANANDTIVHTNTGIYLAILQNVDHNAITAAQFAAA